MKKPDKEAGPLLDMPLADLLRLIGGNAGRD